MIGAITTTLIWGLVSALALRPPRPRRSTRINAQFLITWWINEMPAIGLWLLLLGTAPTLATRASTPWWWVLAAFTLAVLAMLARLLQRGFLARPALARAFAAVYGEAGALTFTRPSWWRILAVPFLSWRPGVRRIRNLPYAGGQRGRRLDIYVRRRSPAGGAPVLIYLHPGGFIIGSKALGAHPLFYHLAARGSVCISADYRLGPGRYPEQLADARSVVAWARSHVHTYGGDPENIFLAGGSAGAHLVATAALTGEHTRGVIGMYGYYGGVGGAKPDSPMECIHPGAPPFLIIHGGLDPLVLPEDARAFADDLRKVSARPVIYAELPGGNHNFDFFPSLRCQAVADALTCFAAQHTKRG